MSLPINRERTRRPTHPGEMLREDFLPDYGLSVTGLAEAAGVSRQSINELLRGRRVVSPDAQRGVDLWDAAQTIKADVARIMEPATNAETTEPASSAKHAVTIPAFDQGKQLRRPKR